MSWLTGRWLDGGLDRIRTPDGASALWLCGKHVVAPDPESVRSQLGTESTEPVIVVCFNQPADIQRYDGYVDWLRTSPHARWFPIPDFHAPTLPDALAITADLAALSRLGHPLVLHCSAGKGRAGTMAVAVLMRLGVDRERALETVRSCRPGAGPEAGAQRDLILALDEHLHR